MAKTWFIDCSSLWVIAPTDAITGNKDARILVDSSAVRNVDTTEGLAALIFTDDDLAERYIKDARLDGVESARFEDIPGLLRFLMDAIQEGVKCVVTDYVYGGSHPRITTLVQFTDSLCKAIDKAPDNPA